MPNLNHRASGMAGLSMLVGFIAMVDILFIGYNTRGGLSELYNLHPVVMTLCIVMITFSSNSYQTDPMGYNYPKTDRSPNNKFHAFVMAVAIVIGVFGWICASSSKMLTGTRWGFHQYVSIVAAVLLLQNMLLGAVKLLFDSPYVPVSAKDYLPAHRTLGILTLVALYLAGISGVYLLGDCDGIGGCSSGATALMALICGLVFTVLAFFPQLLHPERLCPEELDKVLDEFQEEFQERSSIATYEKTGDDDDGYASTGSGSSYSSYDTDDPSSKKGGQSRHTSSRRSSRRPRGQGRTSKKAPGSESADVEIEMTV